MDSDGNPKPVHVQDCNPQETKASDSETLVIFEMDGMPHYRGGEDCCCYTDGKVCKCGGYMHYQPVYGGYYYKCDECKKET